MCGRLASGTAHFAGEMAAVSRRLPSSSSSRQAASATASLPEPPPTPPASAAAALAAAASSPGSASGGSTMLLCASAHTRSGSTSLKPASAASSNARQPPPSVAACLDVSAPLDSRPRTMELQRQRLRAAAAAASQGHVLRAGGTQAAAAAKVLRLPVLLHHAASSLRHRHSRIAGPRLLVRRPASQQRLPRLGRSAGAGPPMRTQHRGAAAGADQAGAQLAHSIDRPRCQRTARAMRPAPAPSWRRTCTSLRRGCP